MYHFQQCKERSPRWVWPFHDGPCIFYVKICTKLVPSQPHCFVWFRRAKVEKFFNFIWLQRGNLHVCPKLIFALNIGNLYTFCFLIWNFICRKKDFLMLTSRWTVIFKLQLLYMFKKIASSDLCSKWQYRDRSLLVVPNVICCNLMSLKWLYGDWFCIAYQKIL